MLKEDHMPSKRQTTFNDQNRLVVVSNRLPVTLSSKKEGYQISLSSGGLVTALAPVLKRIGGKWIGWPGTAQNIGSALGSFSEENGYHLCPVTLSSQEVEEYYNGFSNEVLWPLFHGFYNLCKFYKQYWNTYQRVNEKFAQTVIEQTNPSDFVWVHDYHLLTMAEKIKSSGQRRKCAFFLHTPFPEPENFLRLPWRNELMEALLDYDLLGFQTGWDFRNFLRSLKCMSTSVRLYGSLSLQKILCAGKKISAGVFPISIDYKEFADKALSHNVAKRVQSLDQHYQKSQMLLGVDRLDYSKGIPERLQALKQALTMFPELKGRITLVQIVVPSREGLDDYQQLKREIENLVGKINGEFSTPGWIPIHYLYRSLSREELISYYVNTDMALITPLRDGMNLVAKEYCACNFREDGVLILSEFAGAAAQLKDAALLVNPSDIEGVARAIYRAFHLSKQERSLFIRRARAQIQKYDINWWLSSFLKAANAGAPPGQSEAETFTFRPLLGEKAQDNVLKLHKEKYRNAYMPTE